VPKGGPVASAYSSEPSNGSSGQRVCISIQERSLRTPRLGISQLIRAREDAGQDEECYD